MNVTIQPGRGVGTVAAPPSKSMAHRLLLCAGLAQGESLVEPVAHSQDILATLRCLTAMGCRITVQENRILLWGSNPLCAAPEGAIDCGESGSTLRFFIPLFLLSGHEATLLGRGRLPQRPQEVYETLCRQQHLLFTRTAEGITLCGPLRGGELTLPADISSQFISGLLFALPLRQEDSLLHLTGTVESRSYIQLTLNALRYFGVTALWQDRSTLQIPGRQQYQPRRATVEGDWSNAAFLLALNALGGQVTVTGLPENSGQGDSVFAAYLARLQQGAATLDLSDCPDLGPILMAVAAAGAGAHLTGCRRLRWKESDRGTVMAQELAKCGVICRVEENDIFIPGHQLSAPREVLEGHNDHRIVMALSVLLTLTGGSISGAEAIQKSYPDFFTVLSSLGIEVICHGTE